MARLAADLKDFIDALQLEKPVVVGTSLGCAVIWAYVELYAAAHAAARAATRATTHHAAAHAASTPAAASSPDLTSEVRRRHIYVCICIYACRYGEASLGKLVFVDQARHAHSDATCPGSTHSDSTSHGSTHSDVTCHGSTHSSPTDLNSGLDAVMMPPHI